MPPKLLLSYKNFAANQNISHIGLGVAALNTAKVLRKHGIPTEVFAAVSARDIADRLRADPSFTHCVVSAPWIQPDDISRHLLLPFPELKFDVNVHSNVAFLQADTNGVRLIRQYIDLEQGTLNFSVSTNSEKGTRWLRTAFRCPCAYLPNLYYLDFSVVPNRPLWSGGTLYIGAFGATRPLKNLMSAAGAALEIANVLRADTQLWINAGRIDGGTGVVQSIRQLLAGLTNIKLIELNWTTWPQFRDAVRQMHLLVNVSFTESFNMVTADGVAEGVPSVTSEAVEWVPGYWQAPVDQVTEIARTGRQLIADPEAAHDGLTALEQHNKAGFSAWGQFLGVSMPYQSLLTDPYLI